MRGRLRSSARFCVCIGNVPQMCLRGLAAVIHPESALVVFGSGRGLVVSYNPSHCRCHRLRLVEASPSPSPFRQPNPYLDELGEE
jgi:hypothetical protein